MRRKGVKIRIHHQDICKENEGVEEKGIDTERIKVT